MTDLSNVSVLKVREQIIWLANRMDCASTVDDLRNPAPRSEAEITAICVRSGKASEHIAEAFRRMREQGCYPKNVTAS